MYRIKVLHRIADGLNETGIVTNIDQMFFWTLGKNSFIDGFGIDFHIGDNSHLKVVVSYTGSTSYDDDSLNVGKKAVKRFIVQSTMVN